MRFGRLRLGAAATGSGYVSSPEVYRSHSNGASTFVAGCTLSTADANSFVSFSFLASRSSNSYFFSHPQDGLVPPS